MFPFKKVERIDLALPFSFPYEHRVSSSEKYFFSFQKLNAKIKLA